MEFINYKEDFNQQMYELFVEFQKEENIYMEHTYEEF